MRSASFPLMDLAKVYGVEYGDILAWAGWLREVRVHGVSKGTARLALDAYERIGRAITARARAALSAAMTEHADARWGRPRWERTA